MTGVVSKYSILQNILQLLIPVLMSKQISVAVLQYLQNKNYKTSKIKHPNSHVNIVIYVRYPTVEHFVEFT